MAPEDTLPITFAVPGQSGPLAATRGSGGAAAAPASPLPGRVKASVQVSARRDGGAPVRVTAVPGEDIVALHIEGGPVLLLHPATARDLLRGAAGRQRGQADGDEVPVTVQLEWPGVDAATSTRGLADFRGIVVSAFQVLTGLAVDRAADFAASQVVMRVDSQVDAGLYALRPDTLPTLKASGRKVTQVQPCGEPLLVFLHGTFVDTRSTFEPLWLNHGALVQALFAQYGQQVYALDHPTLGASPIANALTLVQALPDNARLHLLTHSRGGLVAEVLARVAGLNVQGGLGRADLDFFAAPAYAAQAQELRQLAALVQAKGVKVERVVRVACPARGTLLASGRLDAYLSVLKWGLEATGLKLLPAFVDFVGEVARRRADPSMIPGLAAMIPDTPLVNWLNAAPDPIPGELRVVAGDLQRGTTLMSWLKCLLSDAFYWTDNDIVVPTRSMYGGAPRAGGATYLLDQGSDVTHFAYFQNTRTAAAVVQALQGQDGPARFQPIGPLSAQGQSATGARAAGPRAQRSAPDANKPALFVLPGLLGSNLKQGDERIWLSARLICGFERLAYQADGADGVTDDGPIGLVYDELIEFLDASHEVIPFGYDWRRPLPEEALRLAKAVTLALDQRQATQRPVRILAHSMGGLLARTLQLVDPATWNRLMAHPEARLLMLGTPNGGSWAPMQVLSGDDSLGNALAAVGSPFANRRARTLMAAMPGFLQLQAGLLDPQLHLDDARTWEALARQDFEQAQQQNWWHRYAGEMMDAVYAWGLPPQEVLDAAKALRIALDAQLQGTLRDHAAKLRLVVGHAKSTPVGYELGAEGFVYLEEQDTGDGRVALASALLPDVATWTLDTEHGSLPAAAPAFDAYAELLTAGDTQHLARLADTGRSSGATRPPLRTRASRQPASLAPAAGLLGSFSDPAADAGPGQPAGELPALQVTVLNGSLTFVQQPLMLGHYRSLALTGTENVIDRHLGGSMRAALKAGLYPDAAGTQRIFMNGQPDPDRPWQLPQPVAAIVVGLGEEGELTAAQLVETVCQGAKAWAQRAAEGAPGALAPGGIELAATLIGSGGMGVQAGGAARAIAEGVRQANRRIAGTGWPLITRLTLVEWYLDRASEAWRGLNVLAASQPQAYEIAPVIATGTGPLRRQPESGYRGAAYDLVSATTLADGTLAFALDTQRARTEIRAQRTQPLLTRKLVQRAAQAGRTDAELGRALFQLLVPQELVPFMSGTERVVLQLDAHTAPIPWELLDTDTAGGTEAPTEPWAIRTRLLRKLRVAEFRNAPRDASVEAAALVVGEPLVEDPRYPPLPGAACEARTVSQQLSGAGGLAADRVTTLVNEPFDAIIVSLLARPYRIVHVAGHGEPVSRDDQGRVQCAGGVVLSEGVFLGPDEIGKLAVVPELVFINCCHLGGHDANQTLRVDEPVAFAAGVADALIAIGVRCVVAAGWAVDDLAAEAFASAFYRALLAGQPFIDAVAQARSAARSAAPGSNTWAAYQCYGDPDWVLRAGGDAAAPAAAAAASDAPPAIPSAPGLALALEDLAQRTRFHAPTDDAGYQALCERAQRQLLQLDERYGPLWRDIGAVAEAFAVAWKAAGDHDQAIAWFERAVRANDASASLQVPEQLGNLRVRRGWAQARAAQPGDARFEAARAEIASGQRELLALAALHPTLERLALCGSAWKRLAQVQALARPGRPATAELKAAAAAYRQAEAMATAAGDPQRFYPGLNRMALELVAHAGTARWRGFEAQASTRLRESLQAGFDAAPDFWTSVAFVEFDLYEAIAQRRLAAHGQALADGYADLHGRVRTRSLWASVADQALFVFAGCQRRFTAADQAVADALAGQLSGYAM